MFYLGLDLGKSHDHSALAIVEKQDQRLLNAPRLYAAQHPIQPNLLVRRIERVALGTSYPRLVEHIRTITHAPPFAGRCALAIDATGLGAPVVDMLRERGAGCDITAVTITGGDTVLRRSSAHISVPRRDLLANVQLALEQGRLRIARHMRNAGTLGRELLAMRADRDTREHDDLVFALALACWRARDTPPLNGHVRLPGI